MDSILDSIKKLFGISETDTSFDVDIIIGINTALSVLTQLGAGSEAGFSISNNGDIWSDFILDMSQLEMIKTYVYLKTKMIFDPPLSSAVIDVINRQISEFEFRINVQVDHGGEI